ncbi:hypothetical protein ACI65C_005109 [Semiaphis heraclei]
MSNQSSSKSDVNNCSMTNDNNPGDKQTIIFEWTTELEECMLQNMIQLKPYGINKHLSMHLIQRNINKEMNIKIPIDVLWSYVASKLDIKAVDHLEPINCDIVDKDFSLPEEYNQLIIEQGEIIKKLQKECKNKVGSDDGPCTRRSMNKNEANKVTAKKRTRVTSDLLVVRQSPDILSLGRRSCSNKNL